MTENTNTQAPTIEERIQSAIAEAHSICDQLGSNSKECAVAWDVVEELQAEASHQRQIPEKTAFQKYCDDNPEAEECRIYDD